MTKNISILGSTGSIGTQTLEVAKLLGCAVSALTAYSNVELMERQVREFKPKLAVMMSEQAAADLKTRLADTDTRVSCGMSGLCEAAAMDGADTVLNSVVGMVGLRPTLAAIAAGKNIALANKETLVAGGELVMKAAKERGVNIYPVDSEHSAVFQCLQGSPSPKAVGRLILTASGGPFFGKTADELKDITPQQALNNPNWSMGAKITVDSATMMNKGLEIIEASWLFNMPIDKIDVVVHRESIVHSLIEYVDSSVTAQLALPDMRIPIQYALTYPARARSLVPKLSLAKVHTLSFYEPDRDTFKGMDICADAMRRGGTAPAAANGANEAAVGLFLEGKLPFLSIAKLARDAMLNDSAGEITCLDDVLEADTAAREYVYSTYNS